MLRGVMLEVKAGAAALAFTTAAQCAYEDKFDEPFMKLTERFAPDRVGELRMGFIVDLFVLALRMDEKPVDRETAMAIMDEIGGAEVAMTKIGEALVDAFPSAAAEGEGAKSGNEAKPKK